MSKFKAFIKKVASKFSTPVKPLAAEVFKEDKFKMDIEGNVKANKLHVSWYGDQVAKAETWSSGEVEGLPPQEPQFLIWNNQKTSEILNQVEADKLTKLKKKTKNKRIKKKLQKRIDTYGKNSITRN
ncbi:hypothetical protein [Paenibacillus sp. LK1]|uniref:hypothetical protein n=1 Tax=Paenibacillus sp. LK1 TaxID=2053014 RepID=UPI000C191D84|nr:hypothetical protein [Paenibacillus sp. LK1]PIH59102.1 hypothetical protein CS562_14270 [Paenibacillus sp. LK1]